MPKPLSHRAFVALGSNLAEPEAQVLQAFAALNALPQTQLRAQSALYRSAPVGYAAQPDFINAVVLLETALSAPDLLQSLLNIEPDCIIPGKGLAADYLAAVDAQAIERIA